MRRYVVTIDLDRIDEVKPEDETAESWVADALRQQAAEIDKARRRGESLAVQCGLVWDPEFALVGSCELIEDAPDPRDLVLAPAPREPDWDPFRDE